MMPNTGVVIGLSFFFFFFPEFHLTAMKGETEQGKDKNIPN